MSKFYGQVEGCASTTASRRGHSRIRSSVQSYDGSLIMELRYDKNDELILIVEHSEMSDFSGHTLYYGTFDNFIKLMQEHRHEYE